MPAVKVGQKTSCLFRDVEVVICRSSDCRIPWPICYHARTRAAGQGLLLGTAIQHESVASISYWWGVSRSPIHHWRAAFGIGGNGTEGSRRLRRAVALGGLNAREKPRWNDARLWEADELALVGKLPDAEVARMTGRTVNAVSVMRRAVSEGAALG
jgi:hypothetical protein